MKQRRLGSSDLVVSALGLGCMGMSHGYGVPDDDESVRTIHRALDLGITLFDTADVYGGGANEQLVGRALGARRRDVVLATKCGIVPGADATPTSVNGSPAHITAACEASLSRLGTDVIDLYYLHRVDPGVPIEESVGAMRQLVRAGKVRYIGLSEAAPSTIRRAHAVHPLAALQSEYSLWVRSSEAAVLPTCRELGIGFVPFSPVSRGFLSGTIADIGELPERDMRRTVPRFQGEHLTQNLRLVEALRELANRERCTPAQLSLAWLLTQGPDVVPIPGTKRRAYLEENVAAAELEPSEATLAELAKVFSEQAVSGDRYSAAMLRLVDRAP